MIKINLVVTFLIGGIGTLVWYLVTKQINRIESDILDRKKEIDLIGEYVENQNEKIWAEMKEFKENYLDRFEKVNSNINASRETLLDMLHQLDKKIK